MSVARRQNDEARPSERTRAKLDSLATLLEPAAALPPPAPLHGPGAAAGPRLWRPAPRGSAEGRTPLLRHVDHHGPRVGAGRRPRGARLRLLRPRRGGAARPRRPPHSQLHGLPGSGLRRRRHRTHRPQSPLPRAPSPREVGPRVHDALAQHARVHGPHGQRAHPISLGVSPSNDHHRDRREPRRRGRHGPRRSVPLRAAAHRNANARATARATERDVPRLRDSGARHPRALHAQARRRRPVALHGALDGSSLGRWVKRGAVVAPFALPPAATRNCSV